MILRLLALSVLCAGLFPASPAEAAVQTKKIPYKAGAVEGIGYLAWDDTQTGPRPGVLVLHEWWGLDDYARGRAEQLAELGYVAFAADMYGSGKTVSHPKEAGEMAGAVRANVAEWQARAAAALDILKTQPQVNPEQLAAMGYCFGGSTALQLAYSGADLDAVVTFHAALPVPTPDQAEQIKASILVCHGAQDGFIKDDTIQKFRAALDDAGVDWQMVYYGGARHSFTVKSADSHGIDGLKYQPAADRRSWAAMRHLFEEKLASE